MCQGDILLQADFVRSSLDANSIDRLWPKLLVVSVLVTRFHRLAWKDQPRASLLGWNENMASVPLIDEVIAAHGGAERWARVRKLRIQVRIGGNILVLRVKSPRTRTFEVIVDARRVHISLDPISTSRRERRL